MRGVLAELYALTRLELSARLELARVACRPLNRAEATPCRIAWRRVQEAGRRRCRAGSRQRDKLRQRRARDAGGHWWYYGNSKSKGRVPDNVVALWVWVEGVEPYGLPGGGRPALLRLRRPGPGQATTHRGVAYCLVIINKQS